MIRLLVRLGAWLDRRFPEKVVVKADMYNQLKLDILGLVDRAYVLEKNQELMLSRLSTVETNAVHKGAVADAIIAVKALKDDVISLKASLGMNRVLADKELQIMLSGEQINGQE